MRVSEEPICILAFRQSFISLHWFEISRSCRITYDCTRMGSRKGLGCTIVIKVLFYSIQEYSSWPMNGNFFNTSFIDWWSSWKDCIVRRSPSPMTYPLVIFHHGTDRPCSFLHSTKHASPTPIFLQLAGQDADPGKHSNLRPHLVLHLWHLNCFYALNQAKIQSCLVTSTVKCIYLQ